MSTSVKLILERRLFPSSWTHELPRDMVTSFRQNVVIIQIMNCWTGEQFTCAGEFCFFWYSVSGVNEADLGMALGEPESFLGVASALSATVVCDGEALQKHKKQTNGNWAVCHDNSCSLLEIRMWLHTDRHVSCISFTVWHRNNKELHLATRQCSCSHNK